MKTRFTESLVGMKIGEARAVADASNYDLRQIAESEAMPAEPFNKKRVNVVVKKNKIISAFLG